MAIKLFETQDLKELEKQCNDFEQQIGHQCEPYINRVQAIDGAWHYFATLKYKPLEMQTGQTPKKAKAGAAWFNKKIPNTLSVKMDAAEKYEYMDIKLFTKTADGSLEIAHATNGHKYVFEVNQKKREEKHPDYVVYEI